MYNIGLTDLFLKNMNSPGRISPAVGKSAGFITQASDETPDHEIPVEEPVMCILHKKKKPGILKFIGETKFSSGVWCGIALHEPCGKNDGSVAGVRYFECEEHHGIFVTPKNVFPINAEDELKAEKTTNIVTRDEKSPLNEQEHETSDKSFEVRPRSKSDAVINERKNDSNVFSNSPFKCSIRDTKSSSLSNVTYICSSPVLTETDGKDTSEAAHSSSFDSSYDITRERCDVQKSIKDLPPGNASNTLHHHSDLSPRFEVKQSIKLSSIVNSARFPAPAALGKEQDSKLNKTFLVRTKSTSVEKECELGDQTAETKSTPDSNETYGNSAVSNKEDLNTTFVSNNENDGENGRPRSASKSSRSSLESLSSVGSMKSNKERSRLNGTKTPRKLPCPSECSKSKLVKISAEKKRKSKAMDKEAASNIHGKQLLKSINPPIKPSFNNVLAKKNRTKSTSVVAPRSVLATPSSSKSSGKTKSKSISSDFRDGQPPPSRTRLNSSKFATPLASKISAPPSNPLTSTPIGKKSVLENKSILGSKRTSSISSSLSGNCDNGQRSTSKEYSNVESKVFSMQVKNKHSTSNMSVKKEIDSKPAVFKSATLPTSTASKENKSLSAKMRTLSTSAAPKEYKGIARARNLSASCSTKEDIKPAISKLRNISSSGARGGISKPNGLKNSIKSSAVSSVRGTFSTDVKPLPLQPRKIKPDEKFSLKERQNSDELVSNKSAKERLESRLRSCLSSAATPDILKQTPEITRHSVAVQVDPLHHDKEEGMLNSTDQQRKANTLLAAFVQRNREFEASLTALQVYAQKLDQERENASIIRKNLNFTKERYYSAENMLVKESNQRARLEEEMLSAKSDSVVEVALLRVEYERKQEIMQAKLKEVHKKDLEQVRKQNMKSMEGVRHSCDLKLKRVEETYVEDIAQINEKHRDVIAELELQHSKHVDDLVEERHAEIETIKADYDEQLEGIQESLSKSERSCDELAKKLRVAEEEAKRDIEVRIQDAIANYKSLPDELESMKFVLEMKNNEIKKLRITTAELQNKIDELQRIKERAALLEREKESLNFVVENKVHFERQLSLERDKLRLSLDREVATSKRLSLENEELAWRLNSYQNSPTSPTLSTDRFNWRLSGFNSPDSAVYSQKIEESDFEYQMNDTKEIES